MFRVPVLTSLASDANMGRGLESTGEPAKTVDGVDGADVGVEAAGTLGFEPAL